MAWFYTVTVFCASKTKALKISIAILTFSWIYHFYYGRNLTNPEFSKNIKDHDLMKPSTTHIRQKQVSEFDCQWANYLTKITNIIIITSRTRVKSIKWRKFCLQLQQSTQKQQKTYLLFLTICCLKFF